MIHQRIFREEPKNDQTAALYFILPKMLIPAQDVTAAPELVAAYEEERRLFVAA